MILHGSSSEMAINTGKYFGLDYVTKIEATMQYSGEENNNLEIISSPKAE